MTEPKIAFLSSHFSGAIKLASLLRHGAAISSIITIPPSTAAAARLCGYHDFFDDARRLGIPLHALSGFDFNGKKDLAYMRRERFDILLISGWQRLVPGEVLGTLKIGAVGEHGSAEYLPRGRGRSPINWSLIRGSRRFVLHLFMATPEADAGAIIDREILPINEWDTIRTVYAKVGLASAEIFLRNCPRLIDGTWRPLEAAACPPTWFRKRERADDEIRWDSSTLEIHNLVRAITSPYPGARTSHRGGEMIIWQSQPFDYAPRDFAAAFGEVLAVFPDGSFPVKTVDGTLLVTSHDADAPVQAGDILGGEFAAEDS